MKQSELDEILNLHKKWLRGDAGGKRADFSDEDLSSKDLVGANLSCANLSRANLSDANLSRANLSSAILSSAILSSANLSYANLSYANLSRASLSSAILSRANLSDANLSYANLSDANLSRASLSSAVLSRANLSYANLSYAILSSAILSSANLSDAILFDANLSYANLSDAKGMPSSIDLLEKYFEKTKDGFVAFKTFNGNYPPPPTWDIRIGSVLQENVNFSMTENCGCGINVAPLDWVIKYYKGDIWKVLIRWEWLAGVCVPYGTDGKIRCERVELLEIVNRKGD